MGNIVQKKANREHIIADCKTTHTKATARALEPGGEAWKAADTRLKPVLDVYALITTKLTAARAEAEPFLATKAAKNQTADDLVKRVFDEVWNDIGRPHSDPLFDLLFPEGSSVYTDGDVDEQPMLMLLLAELLEANLHPKLTAAAAAEKAGRIRAAAAELDAAVQAAKAPTAKVVLYEKVQGAVARSAQVALANLKRFLKSDGMSEADVHLVIPDRPRDYGTTPEPTPVVTPAPTPVVAPTPAPTPS